jgi:hypothetical protein
MRVFDSRLTFVRLLLLVAMGLCAFSAGAQPQSRISFCLNLAQQIETKAFEEKKQYITKEDDIRRQLTSGCSSLRYEFSPKSEGGFRIIAEKDGDSWSIDEKREVIQVASKDDAKHASSGGPVDAKGKPLLAGSGTGAQSKDKLLMADSEALKRMHKCFAKDQFHTAGCRALFDELEKKCGQDGVPLARLCLEMESQISAIDMADCLSAPDENWGKCELRSHQLEKKCSNQLRQASSECRGLAKFLATLTPVALAPEIKPKHPPTVEKKPGGERKPAAAASPAASAPAAPAISQTKVAPDPLAGLPQEQVDASQAKTLEPSLRTLLRLRPVSYQSKMSKQQEMGFISEEVEMVSPSLVTYNDKGQVMGIKYSQFTALMTSGMQELYSTCRADGDLTKDLIRRMVSLEAENSNLKKENGDLKKQMFNMSNELQAIKDKLGIK